MPWTVELLGDSGIIQTRYIGVVDTAELSAAVRATVGLAIASGAHRALADCSRLEGGHSIADLLHVVESLLSTPGLPRFTEALLLPPSETVAADVSFFETACQNRGLCVRAFHSREHALDWLLGPNAQLETPALLAL